MTNRGDISIDPNAPDDDLDGETEAQCVLKGTDPDALKVLPIVRSNRCMCPRWVAYQNRLLADGIYTYDELYPIDSLCNFDAWDQAHEQDRLFEAAKRTSSHSTTKEVK